MDEIPNPEKWADALLEQHRTAPPGTSLEDEPVIEYMRERSEHYGRLQQRFSNLEAIASLVGVILLALFAFAFYSSF